MSAHSFRLMKIMGLLYLYQHFSDLKHSLHNYINVDAKDLPLNKEGEETLLSFQSIYKKLEAHEADGILVTNALNCRYLSGFTGSAGAIIITKTRALFLTDFRYKQQAFDQVKDFEIILYNESGAMFDNIIETINDIKLHSLIVESDDLSYDIFMKLKEDSLVELKPVSSFFENLRAIKDSKELVKLKKAAEITEKAFEEILTFIKPGMSELEVANNLDFLMRREGADFNGRNMSVASGYRSALPHGRPSEKIIEENEMILLDFGAVYQGYHSDITRTIAIGTPVDELKQIHQIVYDALHLTKEKIEVGMTGKQVDAIARNYISKKGYGDYFGHGTGHGLGYAIHERPFLSPSSDDVLQENMVVTIEPGIYISDLGGVRIEDNIIIKNDQHEVLTNSPRNFNLL